MLTPGQQQAINDLHAVAKEGGPQVVFVGEPDSDGELPVEIVVDCRNAPHAAGGIRLRSYERIRIHIPAGFPLDVPRVSTPHRRWAKTAHVQWGRHPCLYRSPSVEWNPADGIFGYLDRLLNWLERAATGQLDAAGEPIHPPVNYGQRGASIVVRANAPRADDQRWLGVAMLRQRAQHRWDLIGWEPLSSNWIDIARQAQQGTERVIVAPTLILPEPIGFEYPTTGAQLFLEIRRQNVYSIALLTVMGLAARVNSLLASAGDPAGPILVMLGAPGRGVVGQELATHLVGWQVEADAEPLLAAVSKVDLSATDKASEALADELFDKARDWLIHATLSWTRIHEQRPETTIRRDHSTATGWLLGKRVLVLGAGALGAPAAESCVRASARRVVIVDRARVHPGILVRQPYFDQDIDEPKAEVLAQRFAKIDDNVEVTGLHADAAQLLRRGLVNLAEFDLVIDATADRIVRHIVELARREDPASWPTLLTLMIGHDATRGVVTVNRARTSAGAVDILRKLGQRTRTDEELGDIGNDFWPDPPRADLFQPEPGCSDATFVGGLADVQGLAGQLLAAGLQEITAETPGTAAIVVRMPTVGGGSRTLRWTDDQSMDDPITGYQVRLAQPALAEMRAETRRGLRLRGRDVETGGLLLGQVDLATRVIWVDAATGPPPDSILSASYFEHGTQGVAEIRDAQRHNSGRTSDFVGYWHTHPDGLASPSDTDQHGMTQLVERVPGCRRAVMLILGGTQHEWNEWLETGAVPDSYVQVVDRAHVMNAPKATTHLVRRGPTGPSWPGGYRRRHTEPTTAPWWSKWTRRLTG